MKTKSFFTALLLMLGTTLTFAQQDTINYDANLLSPGTEAPNFVLRDTQGEEYDFHKFAKQEYILIDFWASWCPDCRKDMPEIQQLMKDYWKDGLSYMGVSFDTDSAQWKNYVRKHPVTFGAQVSELKKWKETQVSKDYHVQWIPTTYLINPEGKVDYATVDLNKMKQHLAELKKQGAFKPYERTMPQFPGGNQELMRYLSVNVKYPPYCQKQKAEARVMISITVNEDGLVTEPTLRSYHRIGIHAKHRKGATGSETAEVEKNCRQQFISEAMRVVNNMPKWKPGTIGGKPTKVKYTVPFAFRLK